MCSMMILGSDPGGRTSMSAVAENEYEENTAMAEHRPPDKDGHLSYLEGGPPWPP